MTSKPKIKRFRGERYAEQNMVNHTRLSSIRINTWGYMQYGHGAKVFLIDNSFTGDKYLECLMDNLRRTNAKMDELIFMQDNCSIHRVVEVIAFFEKDNWRVLNHPPESPDCNPYENIWNLASRQLNSYLLTHFVNTPTELFKIVKGFIESIPVSMVNHLIDSMPARLAEVRKNLGNHTKY